MNETQPTASPTDRNATAAGTPDTSRPNRLVHRLTGGLRKPLFWVVLLAVVLRLPGLGWGLPASDGWDDDGVAPRNFLVGLAQTYVPGAFFTYPPLHMIWLTLLNLPVVGVALAHAPAYTQQAVIGTFIHVPYMTSFAFTARVLSVLMSVGTLLLVNRLTSLVAGRVAGLCAAAACALNGGMVYYGQVTNLDGPYLFWAVLSLWAWMRFLVAGDLRSLRWAALSAAAAIATKDQAYAVFLLTMPASFLLSLILDPAARRRAPALVLPMLRWAAISLGLLLLVDGAITNPSGFARRMAFLRGPASQDFIAYTADITGRLRLAADMMGDFPRFYPAATALLAVAGLVLMWRTTRAQPALRVAGLVPVLAALSFTLFFNALALRTDNRFLLPQSLFIAPYIGLACARLLALKQAPLYQAARVGLAGLAAIALWRCAGLDTAMLNDPRYDAERWMATHVQPGDTLEAYGRNAFLPRLPQAAHLTRLDTIALKRRNPLPGVTESIAPFSQIEERKPRFLVVPDFWARDFLPHPAPTGSQWGTRIPRILENSRNSTQESTFLSALFDNRLPYRLALKARYTSFLPAPEGYESLGQTIFIFERVPDQPSQKAD
ncbi:MAG: hypothetical protein LKJ54_02095 [Acetobacter peroxydans]|nr:hypothetical protein [Acetobacter peroxydans]MCI2078871.1 hypothetical protein [Acetobacter peroxydans]